MGRSHWYGTPGGAGLDRRWRTAFFKSPVDRPVMARRLGLDGDRQADLSVHGGPDQALLCYASEHYPAWRVELGLGEMGPGGFGENLTITGASEWTVCIGDVYAAGEALVQVSQPRGPCWKIGQRWRRPDLLERVERSGRHGWYLRVLEEGLIQAGGPMTLVERPHPEWTVRRAADAYRRRKAEPAAALELAAVSALAADLRRGLQAAAPKP